MLVLHRGRNQRVDITVPPSKQETQIVILSEEARSLRFVSQPGAIVVTGGDGRWIVIVPPSDGILFSVVNHNRDWVRLSFSAPRSVKILRDDAIKD